MTLIIKEKALFVNIGNHWLNLAQARAISFNEERAMIQWADGKLQGFNLTDAQKILQCLEEYTSR